MSKEEIEKLYLISIDDSRENFEKNIDLYNKFVLHCNSLWGDTDKLYTIIFYVLKNYELLEYEYSISKLLDIVISSLERNCFKFSQTKEPRIDDVDKILKEVNLYNKFRELIDKNLVNIDDSINKNSIIKFLNSDLFIYYLDALTLILSNNYLTIENDKCNEIMNLIDKDGWLNKYLNGEVKNSMLGRDLVLKYIKRILTIKEFVSDEEINDDILVNSLIHNKIKDYRLLQNLFKELSIKKLMSIFDYDIEKLINLIVNLDSVKDLDKERLINDLFIKLINGDGYIYLLYLMKSELSNNKIINIFFTEQIKSIIFNYALKDVGLNKENVIYLLKNNVLNDNLISYSYDLNDKEINELLFSLNLITKDEINVEIKQEDSLLDMFDKIKQYNKTNKVIDINLALVFLEKYFNNELELDIDLMKAIIRSIITEYMKESKINNIKVMFDNQTSSNGSYSNDGENKYIFINEKRIESFLSKDINEFNKFDLFVTMFHEMRHAVQEKNREDNNFDFDTYFMLKETIIKKYDTNYYNSNYKIVLEEIDARRGGIHNTIEFYQSCFPQISNIVENNLNRKKEYYDYSDYSNKKLSVTEKEEYINNIFDKLLSVHIDLLDKYPILKLEYDSNGIPKSYDKLNSENNNELVNDIIRYRYSNDLNSMKKK